MLISGIVPIQGWAQKFSVESYRQLPSDVSAFISPVRDNNGEDCALLKVLASEEFAFSTPLGIVKREDRTGEIWLFLPARSKKITIKHPEWGVMRDFYFTTPLVGHMCYEMKIKEPPRPVKIREIITTKTDTLVLTRIDTLTLREPIPTTPFTINISPTIAFGGRLNSTMGGVMIRTMRNHGVFVHAISNFKGLEETIGSCGRNGEVGNATPFYSGTTKRSTWILNCGAAHRVWDHVIIHEGIGYGASQLAWQLAPSEGGGFLKNNYYSIKGVAFEGGISLSFKRFSISTSAITIQGRDWFVAAGIGLSFGKKK